MRFKMTLDVSATDCLENKILEFKWKHCGLGSPNLEGWKANSVKEKL